MRAAAFSSCLPLPALPDLPACLSLAVSRLCVAVSFFFRSVLCQVAMEAILPAPAVTTCNRTRGSFAVVDVTNQRTACHTCFFSLSRCCWFSHELFFFSYSPSARGILSV